MTFYELPIKLTSPFTLDECTEKLKSLNGEVYLHATLNSNVIPDQNSTAFYVHANIGLSALRKHGSKTFELDIAIKGFLEPDANNTTHISIELAEADKRYIFLQLKVFLISTLLFITGLILVARFPLFVALLFSLGFSGLLVGIIWLQRPYDASKLVGIICDKLEAVPLQD